MEILAFNIPLSVPYLSEAKKHLNKLGKTYLSFFASESIAQEIVFEAILIESSDRGNRIETDIAIDYPYSDGRFNYARLGLGLEHIG
ncbi:MAG: hypothetical protein WCW68_09385 [Methanothrix sp.]